MRQFFGSLETLSTRNTSGGFLSPLPRNSLSKTAGRKFSTMHKVDTKMSQKVDIEVSNADRSISKTLNPEEMMKMEFYSKFSPTSVTLSHFLDHSSGGGTVEDSFLFLRREIPVRLANMMMELEVSWILYPHVKSLCLAQELPAELLNQPACQEILAQYGQSFKDVLSFENIPNNPESHEMFNQMLTNIRQRHQVSLVRWSMICRGS